MKNEFPLNALGFSHWFMSEHLKPGDICIDATAGRGRDTLFLSRLVGDTGFVTAFDIQPDAITSTQKLLESEGVCNNVKLICDCHSRMGTYIPEGSIDGIMFNLGYLPLGDHSIFSKPETTIAALEASCRLLKSGGVISICIYSGGPNGYDERIKLEKYLKSLNPNIYQIISIDFPNRSGDFPIPVFIIKN